MALASCDSRDALTVVLMVSLVMMTATMVMLFARHGHAPASVVIYTQSPPTVDADATMMAEATPRMRRQNYTVHFCKGSKTRREDVPPAHRTCMFTNVCWSGKSLTYYTGGIDRIRSFDSGDLSGVGLFPEDFMTINYVGEELPIDVRDEQIPADAVWHDAPVAAYYEPFIPGNFGHYLLEELYPVYLAQRTFGVLGRDVQVVYTVTCARWPSCVAMNAAWLRLLSTRASWELMPPTPVCFSALLLGTNAWAGERPFGEPQTGRGSTVSDFRDYAIRSLGLDPDRVPLRHSIVVLEKTCCRRMVTNLNDTVAVIRREFPGVPCRVVRPAELSAAEQVDLMLDTTVLVTPEGGISYVALFLARGSAAVFIDNWDPVAGASHHLDGFIWGFLPDLQDMYYPVRREEITLRGGGGGTYDDYRDRGDVTIDLDRIRRLVQQALMQVDDWYVVHGRERPQRDGMS
jgi:hypothetical protein